LVYDGASDTYKPIGWNEAFKHIGEVLRGMPDPNMVSSTLRAVLRTKLLSSINSSAANTAQTIFRTARICATRHQCRLTNVHWNRKGTVSLDDFEHCELIIAMGHIQARTIHA